MQHTANAYKMPVLNESLLFPGKPTQKVGVSTSSVGVSMTNDCCMTAASYAQETQ